MYITLLLITQYYFTPQTFTEQTTSTAGLYNRKVSTQNQSFPS